MGNVQGHCCGAREPKDIDVPADSTKRDEFNPPKQTPRNEASEDTDGDKNVAKEAARAEIAKAIASRDLEAMRTATLEGKAAGLHPDEFEDIVGLIVEEEAKVALEARQKLEEEAKVAARANIAKALASRDLETMRTALDAGVAGTAAGPFYRASDQPINPSELDDIRKAVAEEEAKKLARGNITKAMACHELVAMRKAIDAGITAGLQPSELVEIGEAVTDEEAIEAHRKEAETHRAESEEAHRKEQKALRDAESKASLLEEKKNNASVFTFFTGPDEEVETANKQMDEAKSTAARHSLKKQQSNTALLAAERELESRERAKQTRLEKGKTEA